MWVPVRPRSSRRKSTSSRRGSTWATCGWPLTVRLIVRVSGAMALTSRSVRGRPPVRSRAAGRSGPGRAGSPGWRAGRRRATGRPRPRPPPRGSSRRRRGAGQGPFGRRGPDRGRGHPGQGQGRAPDPAAVAVQLHQRGHRHDGEVGVDPGELGERVPAGPDRQPDLGQDLVRRQGRAVRPLEELARPGSRGCRPGRPRPGRRPAPAPRRAVRRPGRRGPGCRPPCRCSGPGRARPARPPRPAAGRPRPTSGDRSTSAILVIAPMTRTSPSRRMPLSPATLRRSTRYPGLASRKFISGIRLCPPASTRGSASACSVSNPTASSTVVGAA